MNYKVIYYQDENDAMPVEEVMSAEDFVALTYSKIIVRVEEQGGDE